MLNFCYIESVGFLWMFFVLVVFWGGIFVVDSNDVHLTRFKKVDGEEGQLLHFTENAQFIREFSWGLNLQLRNFPSKFPWEIIMDFKVSNNLLF